MKWIPFKFQTYVQCEFSKLHIKWNVQVYQSQSNSKFSRKLRLRGLNTYFMDYTLSIRILWRIRKFCCFFFVPFILETEFNNFEKLISICIMYIAKWSEWLMVLCWKSFESIVETSRLSSCKLSHRFSHIYSHMKSIKHSHLFVSCHLFVVVFLLFLSHFFVFYSLSVSLDDC